MLQQQQQKVKRLLNLKNASCTEKKIWCRNNFHSEIVINLIEVLVFLVKLSTSFTTFSATDLYCCYRYWKSLKLLVGYNRIWDWTWGLMMNSFPWTWGIHDSWDLLKPSCLQTALTFNLISSVLLHYYCSLWIVKVVQQ